MTIELFDKFGNKIASGLIVPDGAKLRVSTMMMDAAPANIEAMTKTVMADAGRQPAMHRPGSAVLTDADRMAREQAYEDRRKRTTDAWRNPPHQPTADAGSTTPATDVTQANTAWQKRQARLAQAWKNGAQ